VLHSRLQNEFVVTRVMITYFYLFALVASVGEHVR
jgi:hypothetical protein